MWHREVVTNDRLALISGGLLFRRVAEITPHEINSLAELFAPGNRTSGLVISYPRVFDTIGQKPPIAGHFPLNGPTRKHPVCDPLPKKYQRLNWLGGKRH